MRLRDMTPDDVAALHAINQQGVPGVGSLNAADFTALLSLADVIVAVDTRNVPAGFIALLGPKSPYKSANYAWFDTRSDDFVYVDRIAIDTAARGAGIGAALYAAAFARYTGHARLIGCEVNTAPPNPGSLRFHKRLGFVEVGTRSYDDGAKSVVYLERAL